MMTSLNIIINKGVGSRFSEHRLFFRRKMDKHLGRIKLFTLSFCTETKTLKGKSPLILSWAIHSYSTGHVRRKARACYGRNVETFVKHKAPPSIIPSTSEIEGRILHIYIPFNILYMRLLNPLDSFRKISELKKRTVSLSLWERTKPWGLFAYSRSQTRIHTHYLKRRPWRV